MSKAATSQDLHEKASVDHQITDRQVFDEDVELPTPLSAWLVVAAACLYYATTLCGVTATGFYRSYILATVGGEAQGTWIADSYLVIVVVLGPSISRIGDVLGRRYMSLFGAFCGFLGCLIVAVASNIGTVIAGCSIFGLAFGMLGNTYAIAIEVVNRHHRATANSFMEFCSCIGVVIALYPGAGFIAHEGSYPGWRSLFWYIAALFVLSGAILALLYFPVPPQNPKNLSLLRRFSKVDVVGTCLLALSLTPFLLGLIWGGNAYPWKSAAVLVPLIGGVVVIFALAAHQYFIEKDGVFAHAMFINRNFPIALYGCLVEGMVYLVINAYFGEETGVIFENRVILLATRYSAFPFSIAFGTPFYSIYVYKTKKLKAPLIAGYLFMLGGAIGLACVRNSQTGSNVSIASICLAGFGFVSPQILLTTAVQLAVPPEYLGLASALTQSARFVGGSVGIAAAGAIVTNKLTGKLPSYVASAALQAGLPSSSLTAFVTAIAGGDAASAEAVSGVTPAILAAGSNAAKNAYADSFRFAYIFIIPFIVLGLVGIFFLHPVNKSMNGLVDRPTKRVQAEMVQELGQGKGHRLSAKDETL